MIDSSTSHAGNSHGARTDYNNYAISGWMGGISGWGGAVGYRAPYGAKMASEMHVAQQMYQYLALPRSAMIYL